VKEKKQKIRIQKSELKTLRDFSPTKNVGFSHSDSLGRNDSRQ